MKILDGIVKNPSELKKLDFEQLEILSKEIREVIISAVSKNGGHLSSNLGVVELTIGLHKVFNIPPDKIIWDVGHQCYTHKILTGRFDRFNTLRKNNGISGFPLPSESPTDIFITGHAGTSISSATGLKIGLEETGDNSKVIAVIGDGSLTNGLIFEGLNFLGSIKKNLIVILNDNRMSISPTKGALSYYLTKIITSPVVNKPKEEFSELIKKIPGIGDDLLKLAADIEKKTKWLIVPGVFFEKLGLKYFGPIDGHDIQQLTDILLNIKEIEQPVVLHVITKKGKGYEFAEKNPAVFHSASPFDIETGQFLKEEKLTPSIFAGKVLEEIAEKEKNLFVITAAMEIGLGLENFAQKFPERFFDVGIAESHAIVLASGLAKSGMKVVVPIYSTFLQRGYDQIFHDICLQGLPVVFLVDRAGIVGQDGPTHHGNFDISYLRVFPDLKIFAPYSLENMKEVIEKAVSDNQSVFIRYPKGYLPEKIEKVKGKQKRKVTAFGVGSMGEVAHQVCEILNSENLSAMSVAMDMIKPLDDKIENYIESDIIVSIEENTLVGGFGSSIAEYIADNNFKKTLLRCGLPDRFIEQGDRKYLLDKYGLSPEKIVERIRREVYDK